ncbi:uncharacterized protein LOC108631977 [Ceratina calcarata]|uniref:Uncharacterized protein LOC108631977 n=1 Tax=Ceratina calcarata TaxID=156304 RepID=A0AAJ7JEP3_9HYME|nr:uncharacterized protein LOC108631977 [Ceratina calcarata]
MFTHLPKGARPEIVAKIIDNYPQFKELYTDYQQIKDIYSLQKMKDYLQLASSIDSVQVLNKQGKLTIIRSLQVVGEHLKNTLMSPKLSDCTNEFLLQWLPENTGKVLMGLRNSLSHAQSLARRTEIEENKNEFFIGVQRNIKKIGNMVNTMLHKEKMKVIKALCLQIKNSKYLDEVAEAFFKTGNEFDIIEKEFQTTEFDELEILVEELNKTTEKTKVEEEVFEKISEIIKRLKNKSSDIQLDYLREFHMLKSLIQYFNISDKDSNTINKIKSIAERLYSIPPRTESCDLQEIVKLLNSIPCRTDHFNTVFGIIYSIIEDETEIKWIKDLQTKLKEKVSVTFESTQKENWNTTKEIYNDVLRLKLTELNNVLTDNKLMENSTDDLFFYKTKKKLQSVIEMLVLDIMSILGYEGYLEKNLFLLDDNSPSLTGRSLRNHLAHDNTITNTLSSNPSLNVLLNAIELVFENTMENKKQIGKSTKDDYLKVRNKRSQSLITIVNQQGMFAALEKGCFKDLRSCLRKGADLHARNTNLWTALHFAAKGPNLKIVKFLLKYDLSTNVKNFDGQSPLHIAAANGRTDIVKYFVEGRGFDANETDKYGKTPLDLAKQHDHNDIVKVLLTK